MCEGEGGRTLRGTRTPSSKCTWRLGPWRILAEYIRRKIEWDASSRVVGSGTSLFGLGARGQIPKDIQKGVVSVQGGTRSRDGQERNEGRPFYFFLRIRRILSIAATRRESCLFFLEMSFESDDIKHRVCLAGHHGFGRHTPPAPPPPVEHACSYSTDGQGRGRDHDVILAHRVPPKAHCIRARGARSAADGAPTPRGRGTKAKRPDGRIWVARLRQDRNFVGSPLARPPHRIQNGEARD